MKNHYEAYWTQVAPPPLDDPLAEKRAKLLLDRIESLTARPRRFLDLGCGEGWLVGELQSQGIESTGVDISQNAIERAKAHYPDSDFAVHEIGVSDWPLAKEAFDVTASFEVIEHLLNPLDLVTAMRDALRMDGYAAITTPYHGLLKNVAISLTAFDKHFCITGDHIRFFTDHALCELLKANGFKVKRISHFGRAPFIWAGAFFWAQKV